MIMDISTPFELVAFYHNQAWVHSAFYIDVKPCQMTACIWKFILCKKDKLHTNIKSKIILSNFLKYF